MSIFQGISPEEISLFIKQAKHHIVYSAPSISDVVATALINRLNDLGQNNCTVILDYDEHVFRLGYGVNEAVEMLFNAGIAIRKQKGLRIGTFLVDDRGWVFNLAPMAVESQDSIEGYNAIQLHPDQVQAIFRSVKPQEKPRRVNALFDPEKDIPGVEIGSTLIEPEEINQITRIINENPPQAFNLQRVVQVYQTHLQFVEIEFEGGNIEQRVLQFSSDLKKALFSGNKEVGKRVRASYKLVEGLELKEFQAIKSELNELREHFAPSLGKQLGRVILKTRKSEFQNHIAELEKQLNDFKESAIDTINQGIDDSISALARELTPSIKNNPPTQLVGQCSNITDEIAKTFLVKILNKNAPDAETLLKNTKLHCTYKDVTLEMLRNEDFQAKIKEKFPYESWVKPFDEEKAAGAK
ncbi:hypothetical protein [Endozoicomonas sp.]|uniref:hypothetical protein n=1 Tax=Endozoicomonas sp. TaxID=1892382 RepID=UPI00383B89C7